MGWGIFSFLLTYHPPFLHVCLEIVTCQRFLVQIGFLVRSHLFIYSFFADILHDHGHKPYVDAELVMRELGPDVFHACPTGVNIHAARTFVDSILAARDAKDNENAQSAPSSPRGST